MNRWLLVVVALVGLSLPGCSKDELSEEEPPRAFIEIGNETYDTLLGTYCWGNTCVDKVGPIEMLEGKESIRVKPGEIISLMMNDGLQPSDFSIVQISEGGEQISIVQDNQFNAPDEKGVYYYYYAARWMDEQEENVSYGDAYYVFALEVGQR
ncbi:hypothetical protein [Sporosarcina beigongshangi]|uniref:hypothetical protein n=1 Tax=Sporosarcina beigongshangi TaxID=2782538 RepID=UPI00193930F7|nr:hypothetical protein [Sporosarcina beigongshangi]